MLKRKIFVALAFILTLAVSVAAFAAYERTADNTVPAYTDPELRNRNGNERVDAGDRLVVLEERENSYYVRYPVRNGTKDRWVAKNVFNNGGNNGGNMANLHIPQGASIFNVMDILNLSKKTPGFVEGTKYTGSGQCRGFADRVYNKLFGVMGLAGYTNNNYGASSYNGSHIVGQLHNFTAYDTGAVKDLFWNVKPGAIIQMGRRHRMNSSGNAPAPHTAIFFYAKKDGSGCVFYEANTDGKNTIKVNSYSWAELAEKNKGFTVYEPNNYPSK